MGPGLKLFVSKKILQARRPVCWRTSQGSIPGEDSFCSSETKYDRRTEPRQNMRITGTKVTNSKTVVGSGLYEDCFSSWEAKRDRTVQRRKLFVSTRLPELKSQTEKLLDSSLGAYVGFRNNFCMIFSDTY
jgi:hypothetical protein